MLKKKVDFRQQYTDMGTPIKTFIVHMLLLKINNFCPFVTKLCQNKVQVPYFDKV